MLLLVLVLVLAGDAALMGYALHTMNPWPMLRGQLVGSALGSAALIGALFQRGYWARYVIVLLLGLTVALFMSSILWILGTPDRIEQLPLAALLAGVLLQSGAIAMIICSRSIARHARPTGSGG